MSPLLTRELEETSRTYSNEVEKTLSGAQVH